MRHGKRYRSIETGETIGLFSLLYGSRHGVYSIERVNDGLLLVNGVRYDLLTGGTDGG